MKIVKNIKEMQALSKGAHRKGKAIGLVPTMGFLHEGHLSLVREAERRCDLLVVSIFVNPTQFGPGEDFKKYPRNLKRDIKLLSKYGVDVVFCPTAQQVYPEGHKTYVEVKDLPEKLCGKSRPGHFRGVTTVVHKLFNAVMPDTAFFGEKDFQQQVIIKKMVKDVDMGVEVVALPTVKEADGLAMSSRNTYLTPRQRNEAAVLYRSLKFAKVLVRSGQTSAKKIKQAMKKMIRTKPLVKIDYVSICDPETFDEVNKIKERTLIALAAFVGRTRLIDNIVVSPRRRS
ncbi:pantoate--beta-alanine ligase [Candidatus Margulisiibacteriota bacterium]